MYHQNANPLGVWRHYSAANIQDEFGKYNLYPVKSKTQ